MSFANSMDPKMFFNDLLSMFVADTKSLQVAIMVCIHCIHEKTLYGL